MSVYCAVFCLKCSDRSELELLLGTMMPASPLNMLFSLREDRKDGGDPVRCFLDRIKSCAR